MNSLATRENVGSGPGSRIGRRVSGPRLIAVVALAALAAAALSGCGDVSLFNNLETENNAPPIELGPEGRSVPIGAPVELSASGGVAPFEYSWSGPGTILTDEDDPGGPTVTYLAPAAIGGERVTATVSVTDFVGKKASVAVTVYLPLSVAPEGSFSLYRSDTQDLTITGGIPPYSAELDSGSGVFVDPATYRYTPPPAGAIDSVKILDTVGNQRVVAATIVDLPALGDLLLKPPAATVQVGGSVSFVVTGGKDPYAYDYSGAGSISSDGPSEGSTVTYTAPGVAVVESVIVSDADAPQRTATFNVQVVTPPAPFVVTFDGNPATPKIQVPWGGTIEVQGSGGTEPYRFSLSYSVEPHGELTGSGTSRTYTAPLDTGRYTKVTEWIYAGDSGGSPVVAQKVEVKK